MSERLTELADKTLNRLAERQARRGVLNSWEAEEAELAEGVKTLVEQLAEKEAAIRKAIEIWQSMQPEDDAVDIVEAMLGRLQAALGE